MAVSHDGQVETSLFNGIKSPIASEPKNNSNKESLCHHALFVGFLEAYKTDLQSDPVELFLRF